MNELAEALRRAAEDGADRVVLVEGERRTRWRDLWQDATALAATLRTRGLQPGERVALIGPNSSRWVQVWLATLLADAVVVPLNPELHAVDLAAQVRHAGARFVFADLPPAVERELAEALPGVSWLLGAHERAPLTVDGLSPLPDEDAPERLGCIL